MVLINIEQSSSEIYSSNVGLSLVGQCLNGYAELDDVCKTLPPGGEITNADMLSSYIGILAQGKSDFEAIENLRENRTFKLSMGIKKSISSSRLRQRFDENATSLIENVIIPCNINFLRNIKAPISKTYTGHVVMDFDTSPFNNSKTKKEDVSWPIKDLTDTTPCLVILALSLPKGWIGICFETTVTGATGIYTHRQGNCVNHLYRVLCLATTPNQPLLNAVP